MSKTRVPVGDQTLQDVKVEDLQKKRREGTPEDYERRLRTKKNSRSDFVYVNNAYVGSLNSVNEARLPDPPVTSVIREQYWACSKWPFAQRILAVVVGILIGAVIGLAVTLIIRAAAPDIDIGILPNTRRSALD